MKRELSASLPLRSLLIPAIVTLAVTLLRLTGELQGWSPRLFGDVGGGGAIVGIVWLVPLFGVYFAWKLERSGCSPRAARVVGHALCALALVIVSAATAGLVLKLTQTAQFGVVTLTGLAAAWVAYRGFPALGRTLFVYGLTARVPVAIVMLAAIFANWHTHYNAPPPGFPEMAPLAKWFFIGFIPQMFLWIPFTMIVGAVFGGLTLLVVGHGRRPVTG
jgi:hypothetical protein